MDLSKNNLIALIGLNECGKSTILKAIMAFDKFCDGQNANIKHLSNLTNYYSDSDDANFKISAEIELIDSDSFKQSLFDVITENGLYADFGISLGDGLVEFDSKQFVDAYKSLLSKKAIVTRYYEENPVKSVYSISHEQFKTMNADAQQKLAECIVRYTSVVNYLNSRPEIQTKIGISEANQNQFWYKIFDNLFMTAAQQGLEEVARLSNKHTRRTKLNNIQAQLTKDFEDSWKVLGADREFTESIPFHLDIVENQISKTYTLEISMQEQITGKEAPNSFDLSDRSDGFKWYYCFVMQLLYNPDGNDRVMFLLDEPGLYLNPAAQVSLLKSFKDKTTKDNNTILIYTTHSHYMLDQDSISPHQVNIVKKDKEHLIQLFNLQNFSRKGNAQFSEITPLHEALQIPFDEKILNKKKVILVEGIHDFYALSLFTSLKKDFYIYPCRGATSIIKHIPFFIMQGIEYVYIVDNDKEGIDKAKDVIEGAYRTEKDIVLPFKGYSEDKTSSFEMDNMFDDVSLEWCKTLDLKANTYKAMITHLFLNENLIKSLPRLDTILNKFKFLSEQVISKLDPSKSPKTKVPLTPAAVIQAS